MRALPGLVDPVAAMPAPTGPYMIPRQGYLEKGYIESSTPYSPGWNPQQGPYIPPGSYASPAQFTAPAGQNYVPQPGAQTAGNAPANLPTVVPSMSPESELALKQSLEELQGKYNLVLDELAELRREVSANSLAITATSEQLDDTGKGLKKVRSTLVSWKKSLDGLEARVRADREAQLGTLDDVESLLMSILSSEEHNTK